MFKRRIVGSISRLILVTLFLTYIVHGSIGTCDVRHTSMYLGGVCTMNGSCHIRRRSPWKITHKIYYSLIIVILLFTMIFNDTLRYYWVEHPCVYYSSSCYLNIGVVKSLTGNLFSSAYNKFPVSNLTYIK